VAEIADSFERALDRIDEFRAIHEPDGVTIEAVLCLQKAVGIADPSREVLRGRVRDGADGPSEPGQLLLGVIVGLLAAQFEAERAEAT
jgi:hypothetical protein